MPIIETFTFRLAAGVDESAFLAVDTRVQQEFAYQQPGLARRTTARTEDGEWIVIDVWGSAADADACDAIWGRDELTKSFMAMVDRKSIRTTRYETLD